MVAAVGPGSVWGWWGALGAGWSELRGSVLAEAGGWRGGCGERDGE